MAWMNIRGDHGSLSVSSDGGIASHVKEIINAVNTLSDLKDIKLCLSSRPWSDFEKAFGQLAHRKLYVHNENREYIRLYIRERFEKSIDFTTSTADRQELKRLVDSMVDDSRGVLLWVFLAVESLLRGLSNNDRISELRQRLEKLPKRLHEMFERMLNSVEDLYQEQAAKILQIALHAQEPMYVFVYSLIGNNEEDEARALVAEQRPWDEEECVNVSTLAEQRIRVRCPDLIKIRVSGRKMVSAQKMTEHQVEFLHRTVRDFLALDETQLMLQSRIRGSGLFDPALFICKALVVQVGGIRLFTTESWHTASGTEPDEMHQIYELLSRIALYAKELEERLHIPQTQILDGLSEIIAAQVMDKDFLLGIGDSFVAMMAQQQLLLYVKEKIRQAPRVLNGPGRPMLQSVLFPAIPERDFRRSSYSIGTAQSEPSPAMVKLLLEHGASPNAMGIWHIYIRQLYIDRSSLSNNLESRQRHVSIIQSCLEHGAEPKSKCIVGYTNPKPTIHRAEGIKYPIYRDIIEIIREVIEPHEREYIELLIQNGRKDTIWRFNVPDWLHFIT